MKAGILDTVSLAATLVFAIPVAMFGVQRLLADEILLGSAFVVLAVLMVFLREWLTTPSDLPAKAAKGVVGRVVETDDDE